MEGLRRMLMMEGSSREGFEALLEEDSIIAEEHEAKDLDVRLKGNSDVCTPIEEGNLQTALGGDWGQTALRGDLDLDMAMEEGDSELDLKRPLDAMNERDLGVGTEGDLDAFEEGDFEAEMEGNSGCSEMEASQDLHVYSNPVEAAALGNLETGQGTNQSAGFKVEMGSRTMLGDEIPCNSTVENEAEVGLESKQDAGTEEGQFREGQFVDYTEDPSSSAEVEDSKRPRGGMAIEEGTPGGGCPLWIKWRGRWQAGIQCSLEDCPATTMRAMPTYGRKTYIVVYFPSTRSFVWTDWQLVCPIMESPEPLAFGSHESGRNSVSDLNAARRYMLRKITAAMLDISDRLPIQAVVESARHVSFWKDFAKEAAKAIKYQELGVMLVTLKAMILSTYLKESWMSSRFEEWKHQCEVAETAGSMEKLIKELKSSVCWDEVGKLWDELEQTNLDSEWKTWKEYAHRDNPSETKSRHTSTPPVPYSPVSVTGHRRPVSQTFHNHNWSDEHARSLDTGSMDSEQCRKRLKHEQHGVQQLCTEAVLSESPDQLGGYFMQEPGNEGQMLNIASPSNVAQSASYEMVHVVDMAIQNGLNSSSAVDSIEHALSTRKMQALHGENKTQNNSVRCSAFSERKGRQCNKYASDGSVYCWKHDPASGTDNRKRNKYLIFNTGADEVSAAICCGTTKHGRRCTHKARDGSSFCLKHLLQDAADHSKGTDVVNSASKHSQSLVDFSGIESKPGTQEMQVMESEKVQGASNRKRKHEQITTGRPSWFDLKSQESSGQGKPITRIAPRTANWTRCIGWCRGSGGQCSHRAKPGFSHCEKHLPGSLGYGGKGQEKYVSKEVLAGLARNSNRDEEKNLLRLRDLVHEYMKARLTDDAARNSQRSKSWQKIVDWILSEVSGDLKASEVLFDLLTAEMESLKKFFEEEDVEQVKNALVPYMSGPADSAGPSVPSAREPTMGLPSVGFPKQVSSTSNGHIPRFRCKICAQEFVELVVLGQHWRACHKKEAQQFFRGYACRHCSLPFTNKKGLERHWNAHHAGIPFQSNSLLVALCIICSGQFVDFEDLWQHVIYSHPDQLCAIWPVAEQWESIGPASDQYPSGLEVAEVIKCFHCDEKFATYSHLHQHEEITHREHLHSAGTSHVEDVRRPAHPGSGNKYKCKICGLRFRLLPDLGRHHQAEHKPLQAMRLKTGKDEGMAMGLIGELNSNIGVEKEKKKLQKLDVRRASAGSQSKVEMRNAQQQNQVGARDPIVTEIEGYQGPKVSGCPNNKDILAVARFACCKNRLFSTLQKKYTTLPERLSIKAAKLCSEANVRLQWHRDGYICPNGCKEFVYSTESRLNSLSALFPSASFVPLQLTAQSNEAEVDYKESFHSGEIVLDESHVVLTAPLHAAENHSNQIVLCNDLSFGKEVVPIPCVVDRDVMGPCNCPMCVDNRSSNPDSLRPWVNFSYVTKRLLDPSLGLDTKSSQLGCMCQGPQCLPEKCDHVYLFDNDNTDARDIYGQPMRGRFPYDDHRCIILEEGYLVYECNSICSCQEDCQNRVLQKGVRVKLEVYKTKHKGWAVRAAQPIARGTFVCEYIGEVLDDREANKRGERYDKEGCSYLYDIDAHIDSGLLGRIQPFVIDATKYGNVARFINHSCSPNLVNYQVLVESMDCQLAHIGLYATRDIEVGEELAYDYRYKLLPGKGCPCHCGAKACRGRLY